MSQGATPQPRRATIRDVATDAGVSVAAVSKVLRNAYGVSEALRGNVLASIERLGYRPNLAARGLRGQSFTVGVLLTELTNPFLPQITDGIAEVIEPSTYKIMFGVGRTDASLETRLIEQMIDYGMDGLILIAPLLEPAVLDRFARQIPIVVVAHHEPEARSFDTVSADDRLGGRLATEALLALGRRDVLMVSHRRRTGSAEVDVSLQRERGYGDAMGAAGLEPRIRRVFPDPARSQSEGELAGLLDEGPPPAVFCWSDLHAVPLRNLAAQRGIRVPQDLALVGYDNTSVAALPLVDLASIDQDGREQGRLAARTLLGRVDGRRDAQHLLVTPHLVVRSSLWVARPALGDRTGARAGQPTIGRRTPP